MRLLLGDLRDVLPTLEPESIDACVTDCPYELGFMGKAWDSVGVSFQPETWAHVLRVLRPGGHLLAFGGTRTYHRIAVAIEDAGFEIRDQLAYMYGSGFPKSLDVSKAIDRAAGAEREVVGNTRRPDGTDRPNASTWSSGMGYMGNDADARQVSAPATEEAARWQGWGTALKPAYEPVVVARKPLAAGTVAANVLAYGVGGLNIDGCRIRTEPGASLGGGRVSSVTDGWDRPWKHDARAVTEARERGKVAVAKAETLGRWPANVVLGHSPDCVPVGTKRVRSNAPARYVEHGAESSLYGKGMGRRDPGDERHGYASPDGFEEVEEWECVGDCPVRMLGEQTGELRSGEGAIKRETSDGWQGNAYGVESRPIGYGDVGGASRFFYTAKTSRAERNAGLDGFEPIFAPTMGNGIGGKEHDPETATPKLNSHPTVKPIELMRWLLRLVVPPDGRILDPFLGSGSTGCAAALEGLDFVGVELDPDYLRIAEARIAFWQEHGEDGLRVVAERAAGERVRAERAATGQLDLLGETA